MWVNSKLARLLGVQFPLIQAPMAGGATTSQLIAAVANAGALGSLGAGYMNPTQIKTAIDEIRKLTNNPFAVNLFIPDKYYATDEQIANMQHIIKQVSPELNLANTTTKLPDLALFDDQLQVIIEQQVPIFSFTFGLLSERHIAKFQKNKTILIGTATNALEAKLLEESGVDIIVAQGTEAGGHRGTFALLAKDSLIGLNALIPQIVNKIKIPLIASGGIMDARGIFAALTLGASGVQLGTAFLTTHESGIHPKYKEALLNTDADNTVLTRSFSGKMARGIKNTFINRMHAYEAEILDYPIQNLVTGEVRKLAATNDNPEFLSMYAGQAACLCQQISAHELVNQLNTAMLDMFLNI